jgi:hypothetical protein
MDYHIDGKCISGLTNLTNLQVGPSNTKYDEFILTKCSFLHNEVIQSLTNLKRLDLKFCKRIKDKGIYLLTNLESLSLTFVPEITGLDSFKKLIHLKELEICGDTSVQWNTLPHLSNSLQSLTIGRSVFHVNSILYHGGVIYSLSKSLGSLTNLTKLQLDVTVSSIFEEDIMKLTKLQHLIYSDEFITNRSLSVLTNLKSLSLCHACTFNDHGLSLLQNLENFLYRSWHCEFTASTIMKLPKLKTIYVPCYDLDVNTNDYIDYYDIKTNFYNRLRPTKWYEDDAFRDDDIDVPLIL